jgi:hypothetical protein
VAREITVGSGVIHHSVTGGPERGIQVANYLRLGCGLWILIIDLMEFAFERLGLGVVEGESETIVGLILAGREYAARKAGNDRGVLAAFGVLGPAPRTPGLKLISRGL